MLARATQELSEAQPWRLKQFGCAHTFLRSYINCVNFLGFPDEHFDAVELVQLRSASVSYIGHVQWRGWCTFCICAILLAWAVPSSAAT